jgi:hypothetical protein
MLVVLEHYFDTSNTTYQMVLADSSDGPDGPVYGPEQRVTFDGMDSRWFTGSKRRPMEDVAKEQRAEVKAVLTKAAKEAEAAAEEAAAAKTYLPGSGDPL